MAQTVKITSGTIWRVMSTYWTFSDILMPIATKIVTKMIQQTPPNVHQKVESPRLFSPKK